MDVIEFDDRDATAEDGDDSMWMQLGPYRINLEFVEQYLHVKDDEGTKIELRFASGAKHRIPVPEESAREVLADLDRLTDPAHVESEMVVEWSDERQN